MPRRAARRKPAHRTTTGGNPNPNPNPSPNPDPNPNRTTTGGSNGPRVPSLCPGSPFRDDDDLDFPRLMLAATPRTQSVGLTDPRVEADMAARARRAPAARAAAKAAVRAEKGYP